MTVRNPEIQEKQKGLEWKEVTDVFDFSKSDNKSPDIDKEKKWFNLIKGELWKMNNSSSKMDASDIDHAFFAYSGKEMDKIPNSPQKKEIEQKRRDLLIDLQNIKDPREKLAAIGELSKDLSELTGTASGSAAKWRKDMVQSDNDSSKEKEVSLIDRVKEFKELLRSSQEQLVRNLLDQKNNAKIQWDMSMGDRYPPAKYLAKESLNKQFSLLTWI